MTFPNIDGVVRGRIDGGGGDNHIELGTTEISIDHDIPQKWYTEYNLDIKQASVAFHVLADKLKFSVENITFNAAGDSGRWKAQCLIGGAVEWERAISPGETSVTLAVEIDATPYQGTNQDIVFRLKSTLGAPPPVEDRVFSLWSNNDIIWDGDTYSANSPGDEHVIYTAVDTAGAALWTVHVKAQGSTLPYLRPQDADIQVDEDGNAFFAFWGGEYNPTTKRNELVDIYPHGGGGPTTLSLRIHDIKVITLTSDTWVRHSALVCVNRNGLITWATRSIDNPDSDWPNKGGYWLADNLYLVDDDTLGVHISNAPHHSGKALTNTVTLLPDTDGSKTQQYLHGESWLCQVNKADGVLIAQPERLSESIYRPNDSHNSGWSKHKLIGAFRSSPAKTAKSGWIAEDFLNWWSDWGTADDYKLYRGGTQTTDELTGDAPYPGYPVNTRWRSGEASGYGATLMVRNAAQGNMRYGISHWANPSASDRGSAPIGVAAIPGTDDLIWGVHGYNSNNGGPLHDLRADRSEQGVLTYPLGNYQRFSELYFRINDNPANPAEPTIAWHTHIYHGNSGALTYHAASGPPVVDDDGDTFAISAYTDVVNGLFYWRRVLPSISGQIQVNPIAKLGAPTYYNAVICAARISDGIPRWVQVIATTNQGYVVGRGYRKGRLFVFPLYWNDRVVLDPLGPNEEDITSAGRHNGWASYDCVSGEYRGYEEDHGDSGGVDFFFNGPHKISGKTDWKDDIPAVLAPVGQVYSSGVPTIINPTQDNYSFTDLELPTGAVLNNGTGEVTWTPTLPDAGPHRLALEVADVVGYSTKSNRATILVEPAPDHQWPMQEIAGSTLFDSKASLDATLNAGGVLNIAGKVGSPVRGVNVSGAYPAGITVPTITFGTAFTFTVWMNTQTFPLDHEAIFDFAVGGFGTNNYRITAHHNSLNGFQPGVVYFQIYDAVGGLLGSLQTPAYWWTTGQGWLQWSFWANGTAFGFQRNTSKWSGVLSSPFVAGARSYNRIGEETRGFGRSTKGYFDHAQLWKTYAVSTSSLDSIYSIENTGTPAFP